MFHRKTFTLTIVTSDELHRQLLVNGYWLLGLSLVTCNLSDYNAPYFATLITTAPSRLTS